MSKQQYPLPILVSGKKQELIGSYRRQVSKQTNKNFSKQKGRKRLMLYNVNCFNFTVNANTNIACLAKELKVDTALLCEYSDIVGEPFDNLYSEQIYYKQHYSFGIAALSKYKIDYDMVLEIDSPNLREVRGAIHIKQYGLNIILTHLDVWDESGSLRKSEITKIVEYVEYNGLENVILLGDFNEASIDIDLLGQMLVEDLNIDYRNRTGKNKRVPNQVRETLLKNNYLDIFDYIGKGKENKPKFSCWTGRLVDYAYLFLPTWKNNIQIADIDFYYTTYSDHLPLIIDIAYD